MVIGQDASRAKDQDNNQLDPNVRQGLRFYAGDKIYVTIRVAGIDISLGTGQQAGPPSETDPRTGLGALNGSSVQSYTLEITLS